MFDSSDFLSKITRFFSEIPPPQLFMLKIFNLWNLNKKNFRSLRSRYIFLIIQLSCMSLAYRSTVALRLMIHLPIGRNNLDVRASFKTVARKYGPFAFFPEGLF